mmetsp:Transcript_4402/g.17308  ORF Transcript_4402/g.17308 Transcript_4402/m.17308 type:complete len:281 (-) Transcript_4402:543-1385(-)
MEKLQAPAAVRIGCAVMPADRITRLRWILLLDCEVHVGVAQPAPVAGARLARHVVAARALDGRRLAPRASLTNSTKVGLAHLPRLLLAPHVLCTGLPRVRVAVEEAEVAYVVGPIVTLLAHHRRLHLGAQVHRSAFGTVPPVLVLLHHAEATVLGEGIMVGAQEPLVVLGRRRRDASVLAKARACGLHMPVVYPTTQISPQALPAEPMRALLLPAGEARRDSLVHVLETDAAEHGLSGAEGDRNPAQPQTRSGQVPLEGRQWRLLLISIALSHGFHLDAP